MLVMFSERLRHCQAATTIHVADPFCLSTGLLTNLGGISLEVSKLSSGVVSTVVSKRSDRGHCVVSVEVLEVSQGNCKLHVHNSEIQGISE